MNQMSIETAQSYDPYVDDVKAAMIDAIADTDFSDFLSVERLKGGEISIKAKNSIVAKLVFRKKKYYSS